MGRMEESWIKKTAEDPLRRRHSKGGPPICRHDLRSDLRAIALL